MEEKTTLTLDTVRVDIDIVDLFEFAKESRRNWIEGNELYKNNHVIIVGVTKIDGPHIHIFCSCLRGSKPSDPPREVNITTSQLFQNWSMHCSCPAGNFRCKHQFACLLYIHDKKDLDALSPTDVRQRWGKIAKNQAENLYEPIPLSNLCGQRKKSSSVSLTDELVDELLKIFVTELPNSALAKSIHGRNIQVPSNQKPDPELPNEEQNHSVVFPDGYLPSMPLWNPPQRMQAKPVLDTTEETHISSYLHSLFDVTHMTNRWKRYFGPLNGPCLYTFYESKVCLTTEKSLSICLQTYNQSNDTWRRERSIRITASECYDLFTFYRNDPGDRDWVKKLSPILHPLEKHIPALQYGRDMEHKALECYRRKNAGKTVIRMGLVIPPSAPFVGCSPDAFVLDDKKLVEIKCPLAGKEKSVGEVISLLKHRQTDVPRIFFSWINLTVNSNEFQLRGISPQAAMVALVRLC